MIVAVAEVGVGWLQAQKAFDAIAAYAADRGWVSTDGVAMRAQRDFPHAR